MRRIRIRRRRALALALAPIAAIGVGGQPAGAQERGDAVIQPAKGAVKYGTPVKLRGRFPGAPNAKVAIEYQRPGGSFRKVASTRTNADSRFSQRVKPGRTGKWRASLAQEVGGGTLLAAPTADSATNAKTVQVRSVTRARVAKRHLVVGKATRIRGKVLPAGSRAVKVKVGGRAVKTRADSNGRFSVKVKPSGTGRHKVKAVAGGNREAAWSKDRAGRVTAYRYAHASWYGPGFYGNRTACGQTLTTGMLGVAHKSLPCGTKVTFRYGGKSVTVPVIDRGPYIAGREYDLTGATRNKLGFPSTGTVLATK